MKYLICLLSIITFSVKGQDSDEYDFSKIKAYKTKDGKIHSSIYLDSVRHRVNQFIIVNKIKVTKDTIYYSLKYFDKSEVADRYEKEGSYCGNDKRKNIDEIRKLYPYNEIKTIRVVSFKMQEIDGEYIEEIPKTNGKIDFQKMFEIKTLTDDLKNKILDILINYDNKTTGMEIAFCYDPRNAIIFLDKNEKVIGYIEICFSCQQFKIEPATIKIGEFCNEKMDAIQGILMKAGITYGMKREE